MQYLPEQIDGLTLFGSMFTGVNDAKSARKSLGNTYEAKWTGFSVSVQAGVKYLFGSESIKAGPFVLADYHWSRTPSITEKGSGLPQKIYSHHKGNTSSLLGLTFQGSGHIQSTNLTSDLWLGWRHNYTTTQNKISSKFVEASPSFFTESERSTKDSIEGSLRISFEQKNGLFGGVQAWGGYSGKSRTIGANLFIGKKF